MAKEIKFSKEARYEMAEGIKVLYDATRVTLGPKGRNVIIEQDFGAPLIINDGVTIAKAITLENKFQNLGASMLIEAASKTNDMVGDGTTTAILLSAELILAGLSALDKGCNPVLLRNGFNYYLGHILSMIDELSTPISSEEDIQKVATLSSQSKEIGSLITRAYTELGLDAIITVEESQGLETNLDLVKGYSYDRGYLSPYMANKQDKMLAILDKPYILITDKKINSMQEILPFLEYTMKSGKSLLIICDDIEQEVLAAIVLNKLRGVFNVVVTKSPSFGERKTKLLEDLALITGATYLDTTTGIQLQTSPMTCLGSATTVKVSRDQTIIVDGYGDSEKIIQRANALKQEALTCQNEYDKEKILERVAKLLGGIAVIKVGAPTEVELKEKKLRIEDALNATKCAMEAGIIEGGGKVLYEISEKLLVVKRYPEYNQALDILVNVLRSPFKQIIANAGEDYDKIIKRVNHDLWFDAQTSEICNLKTHGIIDPSSVLKSAVTTSISIASIFLTTECAIVDHNIPKSVSEDNLI